MPECRTGCTVMVAVGTIKLRRADTASGMPMECPPPSTSVAVGLLTPAISSASASPASTSPPTVLRMTSRPSISGSSSMSTSCGMTCSYLVVFWLSGERVCPSMVPMTVRQWMACRPVVAGTLPRSVMLSCRKRFSSTSSFLRFDSAIAGSSPAYPVVFRQFAREESQIFGILTETWIKN